MPARWRSPPTGYSTPARSAMTLTVPPRLAGVSAARADALHAEESARYAAARPRCRALSEELAQGFYRGVPMHWMRDWPTLFPMVVTEAAGASITDADGHRLADFCLGDTGAMFGHS